MRNMSQVVDHQEKLFSRKSREQKISCWDRKKKQLSLVYLAIKKNKKRSVLLEEKKSIIRRN